MTYQSQAWLEGTILYIDGRVWDTEVENLTEALEILDGIKVKGVPKSVRVFTRPRTPQFDPVTKRRQR